MARKVSRKQLRQMQAEDARRAPPSDKSVQAPVPSAQPSVPPEARPAPADELSDIDIEIHPDASQNTPQARPATQQQMPAPAPPVRETPPLPPIARQLFTISLILALLSGMATLVFGLLGIGISAPLSSAAFILGIAGAIKWEDFGAIWAILAAIFAPAIGFALNFLFIWILLPLLMGIGVMGASSSAQ